MKQSEQTGDSIRTLGGAIEEASQAATQIAASAQQQSVGMDQVAIAVENIRQASSQNVESMRQVEVVAMRLHDLGETLKRLTERYRV